MNLTINNSSSSSEDVTACDSFDWNGVTYTESGTYTFESTNESGCTHTATLNLTINNSSSSSEDIIIIDSSYEWNGTTYTESGIYTFNTINDNGCLHVSTLNLTIEVPTCIQPGDANCDNIVNLADLSLVINNWLTSVPTGQSGDVIGSEDGFVNLEDLSLIINNWLQTAE